MSIKNRSSKGAILHSLKIKIYKIIDQKAYEQNRFCCWGCGGNCGAISHSHLIPGSKFVAEEKNIWLMGFGYSNSCHDRWESHNIEEIRKIPNYRLALKAVKELDKQYYYRLIAEK